jgi:SPP1 family predicted phage head-tail adaptor
MAIVNRVDQLNERIALYSVSMGKVNGVPVSDMRTDHFKTWAMVRSQYLNEIATNAGGMLEDTITFVIRYDQPEKIMNTWRVEWQGKQYNIVKLNPDTAAKKWTTIICKLVE